MQGAAVGAVCAWTGALLLAATAAAADSAGGVRVIIETPASGEVVRSELAMAPLAGHAQAGAEPTDFDVMFVVDVSGSTEHCSLVDVDGDGVVGEVPAWAVRAAREATSGWGQCSDPQDSIVAAEVRAGLALLDDLDPARIRVGVVAFSGALDPSAAAQDPSSSVDARLEQPLTHDFPVVRATLDALAQRLPAGGTNIAHGLRLAIRELQARGDSASSPRAQARKVALLLTDGLPSLPFGDIDISDPQDIQAALAAAREAALAGIQVNVFALGISALAEPFAATEVARVTGGIFHGVRRPGDIVSIFSGVTFANVNSVVAVNLTSGEASGPYDIHLKPDGSFRGFVPVVPGRNRVRVAAYSTTGERGATEITIDFRHQELTTREMEAELERLRQRTRAIQLEAERIRQEQYRRREKERAVSIEVEDSTPPTEEKQP
jgi:Mg-chelatase subunit ChlD